MNDISVRLYIPFITQYLWIYHNPKQSFLPIIPVLNSLLIAFPLVDHDLFVLVDKQVEFGDVHSLLLLLIAHVLLNAVLFGHFVPQTVSDCDGIHMFQALFLKLAIFLRDGSSENFYFIL